MKKLKLKPLSSYVKTLEQATVNIVTADVVAQTLHKKTEITLIMEHSENWTPEGQISSVTHEVIHQAHAVDTQPDPVDDKKQEEQIERLVLLLMARPEWQMIVLFWLNQALTNALNTASAVTSNG